MGVMKRLAGMARRPRNRRIVVDDEARRFTGTKRGVGRLASTGMEVGLTIKGAKATAAKFDQLDAITRRKVLRKATTAASGVIRKAVKQKAPRKTGLLRKSLGSKVVKYQKGNVYTAIIGQAKGIEKQKGFSKAVARAVGHKKRGGLSGEGVVLPLWLVNNPVEAHGMPGKRKEKRDPSKPYVWTVGRKRIYREYIRNHPGHSGSKFIQRGAQASQQPAGTAFRRKFKAELALEMRKLRSA